MNIHRQILLGVLSGVVTVPVLAEVVLDGALGTSGAISGPNFVVQENFGARLGNNLLHSFSSFSVAESETVSFEGAAEITNIISRVTGSSVSNINGGLEVSIPDANFWLLNPNGIVIGESATIDLDGSFYLSTADSVFDEAGNRIMVDASDDVANLSFSDPVGFGFVSPTQGNITLNQTLDLTANRTLGAVSQVLTLEGAAIRAVDGSVVLMAANEGDIVFSSADEATGLNGTLNVISADLEVSGDENISVVLGGGDVSISEASDIQINNTGKDRAGSLILIGGDVHIGDSELRVTNSGLGGTNGLMISADDLTVNEGGRLRNDALSGLSGDSTVELSGGLFVNNGEISNFTSGSESVGGDLTISASTVIATGEDAVIAQANRNAQSGDLVVTAEGLLQLVEGARLSGQNITSGTMGDIVLRADALELMGGQITNNAFSDGIQGNTVIEAGSVLVGGGGSINNRNTNGSGGDLSISTSGDVIIQDGLIATDTFGSADGGNLSVSAENIMIRDGAIVSIGSRGAGNSGGLNLEAQGTITISGQSDVQSSAVLARTGDLALATVNANDESFGTGEGGSITLVGGEVRLENNAIISSQASRSGNAGSISITADTLTVDQATIETEALASAGGNIELSVSQDLIINNSEITAAAGGVSASDAGGNITVNRPEVLLLNQANIFANANAGNGGNITVASGGFIKSPDSITDASSNKSEPGEISVRGLTNNVTALESLSADYADVSSLLSQICAQSLKSRSTFVVEGGLSKNKVPSIYGRAASAEAEASTAMRQEGAALAGAGQSGEALLSDLIAQACPN